MTGIVSRVVVGIVGLPVVLALVWAGGWWLFGLLAFAAVVAVHEFVTVARPLRPLGPAAYLGVALGLSGWPLAPACERDLDLEIRQAVLPAVVVTVAAAAGALSESMLNRDMQVKDTGALLGGHGGVLARIDSLLFAAPAAYYLVLG